SPAELKATLVLSLPISEASAKVRTGPPVDDEADYDLLVWAGVLPLSLAAAEPVADPRLAQECVVPGYIRNYRKPGPASCTVPFDCPLAVSVPGAARPRNKTAMRPTARRVAPVERRERTSVALAISTPFWNKTRSIAHWMDRVCVDRSSRGRRQEGSCDH